MRLKIGRRIALALLWILPASLFSSNFHEHLFSLPFPEHIASEHEAIFSLPEKSQRLSCFFLSKQELSEKLALQWKGAKTPELDTTLKELCAALPGTPEENLRKLLTFSTALEASQAVRVFDYETCETLRKTLLLALPLQPFLRIYDAYFKEEPLENREVISATVTRRFFDPDQESKYAELVTLAKGLGTRLIYRVSLQRNTLLEEGIALPSHVLSLLDLREIGGVDVVGSLKEATYTYPFSKEAMQRRLSELFEYASARNLVIVFHLFETSSDDIFYGVLKEVLTSWRKPLFIEIGHVASITDEWIDLFASNPSLNALFHINPESNCVLHNTSLSHLKRVAHTLTKRRLPVVLGSDGRGILPGSSYLQQKAHFKVPLSPFSYLSLSTRGSNR